MADLTSTIRGHNVQDATSNVYVPPYSATWSADTFNINDAKLARVLSESATWSATGIFKNVDQQVIDKSRQMLSAYKKEYDAAREIYSGGFDSPSQANNNAVLPDNNPSQNESTETPTAKTSMKWVIIGGIGFLVLVTTVVLVRRNK